MIRFPDPESESRVRLPIDVEPIRNVPKLSMTRSLVVLSRLPSASVAPGSIVSFPVPPTVAPP